MQEKGMCWHGSFSKMLTVKEGNTYACFTALAKLNVFFVIPIKKEEKYFFMRDIGADLL